MKAYRNDQSVTLVTGQDARKKDRTKEKVDDYKCVTRAENLYPENFVTLMFNLLKGEMLSNFIFFNTNWGTNYSPDVWQFEVSKKMVLELILRIQIYDSQLIGKKAHLTAHHNSGDTWMTF